MENNFLLESLAACHDSNSKLVMYFMVKNSFCQLPGPDQQSDQDSWISNSEKQDYFWANLTFISEYVQSWLRTTNSTQNMKDLFHQYTCKREIFDLKERHDNTGTNLPNKNFFSNNFIVDVFLFVTAIILLLVTALAIYLLCKHKKLRTLVTSLALQQIKEAGALTTQEHVTITCSLHRQFYIFWH